MAVQKVPLKADSANRLYTPTHSAHLKCFVSNRPTVCRTADDLVQGSSTQPVQQCSALFSKDPR